MSAEEVLVGSPLPPAMPVVPTHATNFAGVAALCVDLARVVDTRALPSLLDRTADILDASGIILWIADPDGRELNPIFARVIRSSWSTGSGRSPGMLKMPRPPPSGHRCFRRCWPIAFLAAPLLRPSSRQVAALV